METTDFPIDEVMQQVEARMRAPETSQLDIYVWSTGIVTSQPSGHEPDQGKLVALITPTGGDLDDLDAIRVTIMRGIDTVPEEPDTFTTPAAGLAEVPAIEPERTKDSGRPG